MLAEFAKQGFRLAGVKANYTDFQTRSGRLSQQFGWLRKNHKAQG